MVILESANDNKFSCIFPRAGIINEIAVPVRTNSQMVAQPITQAVEQPADNVQERQIASQDVNVQSIQGTIIPKEVQGIARHRRGIQY